MLRHAHSLLADAALLHPLRAAQSKLLPLAQLRSPLNPKNCKPSNLSKQVIMDALHAEKLEASDEAVRSLVDGVFRDYDTTKSGGLTFQEFEAWLGHEPDVAALLGLEKVFALWLNGDSVEAAGRGSGRRGRRPGVGQRLKSAALEALDNYRSLLARGLYLGACAAIIADRVVEFAVRRDSYPSLVVARVSGGLLNLHIVLVRLMAPALAPSPLRPSQWTQTTPHTI